MICGECGGEGGDRVCVVHAGCDEAQGDCSMEWVDCEACGGRGSVRLGEDPETLAAMAEDAAEARAEE